MSREKEMIALLQQTFHPHHLVVRNDSGRHHGHAGDDGTGESHFYLEITAEAFKGLTPLERQRQVNKALQSMFDAGLHAVEMKLRTP